MKINKLTILFVLIIVLLTACSNENANAINVIQSNQKSVQQTTSPFTEEQVKNLLPAVVTKNIDGDTLKIKIEGKEETVRLLCIDTPESVKIGTEIQKWALEASDYAKKIMPVGKKVQLELDVSERDKYGRLLGYIWVDGEMYNNMVIEQGLARVAYIYAPNTKYVDQLRETQSKAQKKAIGIWSIENYVTDSGFDMTVVDEDNTTGKAEPTSTTNRIINNSSGECNIKGNISKNGKIYHVPGGEYYEQTKAEKMFCTEEEAVADGFRKSQK